MSFLLFQLTSFFQQNRPMSDTGSTKLLAPSGNVRFCRNSETSKLSGVGEIHFVDG